MRLALIDHYDSFTFNVIDWLTNGPEGVVVDYIAGDDEPALKALLADPRPLVLSPGPKRPEDAPLTLAVTKKLLGKVPILGVCLGHQLLAVGAGAAVYPCLDPFHGSTRRIFAEPGDLLFAGLPATGFTAAVYNSLVVDPRTLPPPWQVTARCDQGEVQAIAYRPAGVAPAVGIQFHPESFLSDGGQLLRTNWLLDVQRWQKKGS